MTCPTVQHATERLPYTYYAAMADSSTNSPIQLTEKSAVFLLLTPHDFR